jgi:pilus assembly protein FimV
VLQVKFHQLGAGLLLLFASATVWPISLGQVQMHSSLGQPLWVEIPIYDTDDGDLQTLTVVLASEEAFRRLGMQRKLYRDIQIQVHTDENGQLFVQLRTDMPFNEPVFNLSLIHI